MKLIIAALALVAIVAAAPTVEVVEQYFEPQPDGSYTARYVLSDGTYHEEKGVLKEALGEDNKLHTYVAVEGKYGYVNPNGENEDITFTADDAGYRAQGKSIPQLS